MLIQAALNGDRTRDEHARVPLTRDELARDAAACVMTGAGAIHLHPRDANGRETLDPSIVDDVVINARSACGVPVGVTTGEWIEPDLDRRLALVRAWRAPDYSSVNLSEPGSIEVIRALLDAGVGIEAGVWTVEDAELLLSSGLAGKVTRILVEPGEQQVGSDAERGLTLVNEIHATLDRHDVTAPRLQHGDGAITWPLLIDAIRHGIDTRVGLEDTLRGPDGEITVGNEALVCAAAGLRAGTLPTS